MRNHASALGFERPVLATILSLMLSAPPPVLSADPNAPASGIGWRDGRVLAVVAARIPAFEPTVGFVLRVPALVELTNVNDVVVPWERWRARISIEAGWRWSAALTALVLLEHESDHESDGGSDFVNLNSVALRVLSEARTRDERLAGDATIRLHVLTCTDDPGACSADGGLGGSRAFEAALGLTWSHELDATWSGFIAAFGSVLVGHGRARGEARLSARVGVGADTGAAGRLALYGELTAGSALGLDRRSQACELGLGLRWSP